MSNHDPYSDSPGSWLVGTTKVYSGVGADIVMESITLTRRGLRILRSCLERIRAAVLPLAMEVGAVIGRFRANRRQPGSYPETLDPYRNCPERTACINLQELVVGQFR